jgi:hypothetical protein
MRLDATEDRMIDALPKSLVARDVFLLGMRWKGYRDTVVGYADGDKTETELFARRAQLLKRLTDAGLKSWEEELTLCAAPARLCSNKRHNS